MIHPLMYKVILVMLFILMETAAQQPAVRFNHIDIEDGLSQNMIKAVRQDSKGFIWIATWNGLNMYDGYNFKVYKHIDGDSTSLRVNKITSILEDNQGRIWIGTFGGGLSLFNRQNESFTNFIHNPNDSGSISSNKILSLYQDSKNRIWIGTGSAGPALLDLSANKTSFDRSEKIKFINLHKNSNPSAPISSSGISSIFQDKFGSVWLSSSDGSLYRTDVNSTEIFSFKKYSSALFNNSKYRMFFEIIAEDIFNPQLFWMVDFDLGLYWFDSAKGKFLNKHPYLDLDSAIFLKNIESMLVCNDNEYWIGTYGSGVYIIHASEVSEGKPFIEHFALNPSDPYGISSPNITSIMQDKAGLIWMGTSTNGIYTHHKRTRRFNNFFNVQYNLNSLTNDNVLSVLEDKRGNVWIGTEIGLDKYNPLTNKYTHYQWHQEKSGSISSNIVYAINQDNNNNLWFGTAAGLDKYDPNTDSFVSYINNPLDSTSISTGEIIKIFTASDGTIWIGSWNGGLNKMEIINDKVTFKRFIHNEDDTLSISDNRIMSIAEDPAGNIWIGTADGGLNKLITNSYRGASSVPVFIRYKNNPNDPNSLSNNDVRSIYIDSSGVLWLGTFGGGLNKFNPNSSDQRFFHYRAPQGLMNDIVRGILPDSNGNLWISTANGLFKFNPEKNLFWNFTVSDGLQTSKFEDVSFRSNKSGKLYFGGVGGLTSFNPEDIQINSTIPDVFITSFTRYNKNAAALFDEKGLPEKDTLILSYDDNILNFEFSALNFFNPEQNNYAYKLEGYNDSWIHLGTKRDVTFTNLDPGEYTLYVKGSNNNLLWNEHGTSLLIKIKPPWYRSAPAFILYSLIFIAGIILVDRIMRRRVIKQERIKSERKEAELIKQQAAELETVDRLVKVINQAQDLQQLFNSLLKQTITFIPQAEKAAVLLLDGRDNLFKIAYTVGYEVSELEPITFNVEEIKKRYTAFAYQPEEGIYIIDEPVFLFNDSKLSALPVPLSMLVMAVEYNNSAQAYVVFDNFSKKNAFSSSEARLLYKFRQHAISAITKAQALKSLQDKNDEIIRTQEQLITQQKLASLGALTAGIAHEIKNPLNFVNNFAELSSELVEEMEIEIKNNNLSAAANIAALLRSNLHKINAHGTRADSIIKSMLLHSRGSSGEKMNCNINELVDQYAALAYHGLRARDKEFNIKIEKFYDKTLPEINLVPQDISRAFLNIINNACYAAFQKYKTSGNGFTPELIISTKNCGSSVEISVKDNGNGIPPEIKNNLFTPFFTTKPAGEGTGLGLSLSYDIIVKQHMGQIRCNTEPGRYTEFIISLPR